MYAKQWIAEIDGYTGQTHISDELYQVTKARLIKLLKPIQKEGKENYV